MKWNVTYDRVEYIEGTNISLAQLCYGSRWYTVQRDDLPVVEGQYYNYEDAAELAEELFMLDQCEAMEVC